MSARRRRVRAWPRQQRCICGHRVQRYMGFCSECGRAHRWGDVGGLTGAEGYRCQGTAVRLVTHGQLRGQMLRIGSTAAIAEENQLAA